MGGGGGSSVFSEREGKAMYEGEEEMHEGGRDKCVREGGSNISMSKGGGRKGGSRVSMCVREGRGRNI